MAIIIKTMAASYDRIMQRHWMVQPTENQAKEPNSQSELQPSCLHRWCITDRANLWEINKIQKAFLGPSSGYIQYLHTPNRRNNMYARIHRLVGATYTSHSGSASSSEGSSASSEPVSSSEILDAEAMLSGEFWISDPRISSSGVAASSCIL